MKCISLYIDLVFSFILLPLMIFAFPVERWWATAPMYFGLFVTWLYASYFLFRHFIVPRLFRDKRRRTAAMACIAASVAVTALFSSFEISSPYYHLRQQRKQAEELNIPRWGARPNRQAVWLHFILVATFSFAVGMVSEVSRQRLAREQMELERKKAELALYKVQINPHFLFNTLNNLYGLFITGSDRTGAMLEKFISLTKYLYMNAERDFIPLRDEVKYIEQYIELQKLRIGKNVDVKFSHSICDGTQGIPPMLLITFVENAFKYGISSIEPCFIMICLDQGPDGTISFMSTNSVCRKDDNVSSTGTGLTNCRRRLELIFPGRYELSYGLRAHNVYAVTLTIRKEAEKC
ncbi:MAG: sensor histidine kinase [Muribaculaceae bacterium]